MKTLTMTNLLLLASMTLFTACANKKVEPKKITITERPKQPIKTNVSVNIAPVKNLPLARTYPVARSYPLARTYPMVENTQPHYGQNSFYQQQVYSANQYEVSPPQAIYSSYRSTPSNVSHQIEWDAKRLLGKKYVWGATGPRTYDCSGFTQKIYRDAGINIPRVSRDQARVGQYVSFNQMRKGDLVFFDTHKKRTGKVTHVGIYLGNGNFIHASSGAKKIVIFNFNQKKFYKKRFLWARRVIKDPVHYAMR